MTTQRRVTEGGPLFDADGAVIPAYATRSLQRYDRRDVRAAPWRLKEWDFYQISDGEKCAQFVIGHVSYAGSVSAALFSFDGTILVERTALLALPFGRLGMPRDAEEDGILEYAGRGTESRFQTLGSRRRIRFASRDFRADIELERLNPDSIAVAIPFRGDRRAFYYNQKINCMAATGTVTAEGREHRFEGGSAFGLLDWGRGVWPFTHEWYWSNGTGVVGGELFGFNLGCGFGDTSRATENMLFYRGTSHKLGAVRIEPGANYMEDWRLRDDEGKLDLTMSPRFDHHTKTQVAFLRTECHQTFGTFSGTATLDDGAEVRIEKLTAFAEHAVNRW